jgi:uncharacterized membrane protein (TIGR02234 family)
VLQSRALSFAALGVAGLLAVVAAAQPWWRAVAGDAETSLTGTEATGGLGRALALVALAGTLLVLVLKARGRRVVAGLLAATGGAVAVLGALRPPPAAPAVRAKLRQVSLDDQYALDPTLWPYVFAGAGLLLLAGAALLWLGAPHWPARRDRFDRAGPDMSTTAADDPAQVWRALDAGLDPTASDDLGQARAGAGPARDPIVQIGRAEDTMGTRTEQHHLRSDPTPPPDQLSGGSSP